jgi:hypothetical protein
MYGELYEAELWMITSGTMPRRSWQPLHGSCDLLGYFAEWLDDNSMSVMEEDHMAMSLLYALLDVNDLQTLETAATQYPKSPDLERALKYKNLLTGKQRKEVREALYDALYAILEGGDINRDLNMAIGKALCNAISGNLQGSLQNDPDIERLYTVLKPIVTEAIDEV